ncbi:Imm49 family immunity protein [Vibrio vulnificus]|nr:immunity 49 family protein [Vibrio vulnificus]EJV2649352.1 immunity 49 family protein [Vibrio vulnificus]MCU8159610.1 Imm49 family immunity protein [Vibrio vulnificus]
MAENYNLYHREKIMLPLNKLSVENVEGDILRANTHLNAWIERFKDTSRTTEQNKQSVFKLTSFYMMLAYGNYALENYSEVKPNLIKAAPFAFLRGFDSELRTHNNDWTIQQELNICLIFGDADIINKMSKLANSYKPSSIMHNACYLYDLLLIKIGTHQPLEQSDIDDALTEAKNTKNKDVQQYIYSLIEAIQALTTGNQALWQESITKAIAWHTDECKFGDYKDMLDGFMCLNALTMAKLGKELHGWHCTTNSLYLPLFLID